MKKIVLAVAGLIFLVVVGTVIVIRGGEYTLDDGRCTYTSFEEDSIVDDPVLGTLLVDQGLLMTSDKMDRQAVETLVKANGGEIMGEIELLSLYQIGFETETVEALKERIEALEDADGVLAASFNHIFESDDMLGQLWSPIDLDPYSKRNNHMKAENMGFVRAWRFIKGSKIDLHDVTAGIVDQAINSDNEELGGLTHLDLTLTDPLVDDLTHGAMVFNIMAANYLDDYGMSGIASILDDKLTVVSGAHRIKSFSDKKDCYETLKLLIEQIGKGASVVNCSFGTQGVGVDYSDSIELFTFALEKLNGRLPEVVIVASAGNKKLALDGKNHYPGGLKLDNLITVASLDDEGQVAVDFTNYQGEGGEVTLAAYGDQILVGTVSQGEKALYDRGTSFSAPFVAGTVALMQAVDPDLTALEIKEILVSEGGTQTKKIDGTMQTISSLVGGKILRADQAVLRVMNTVLQDRGKDAFTAEQLLDYTDILLKAIAADSEGYDIAAMVFEPYGLTASLTIETQGNEIIDGETSQMAGANDMVWWTISDDPDSSREKVVVRRLDTDWHAFVYLTEPLPDEIDKVEGYPEMMPFKPRPTATREEIRTLRSSNEPVDPVHGIFGWEDKIGDADQYPDQSENYGWQKRGGLRTYYHVPDLELHVDYYGGGLIRRIRGIYTAEGTSSSFVLEFHENGQLAHYSSGTWNAGLKWDMDMKMDSAGNYTECMMLHDLVWVKEVYYPDTMQLKSIFRYRDGLKPFRQEGVQEYYHASGQLSIYTEMKDGLNHGVKEEYDQAGNVTSTIHYFEGERHGDYLIYQKSGETGQYFLREEAEFASGKASGTRIVYEEDGSRQAVRTYLEGIPHGLYENYIEGWLRLSGMIENGSAVGDWILYKEDGTIEKQGPVEVEVTEQSIFPSIRIVSGPGY